MQYMIDHQVIRSLNLFSTIRMYRTQKWRGFFIYHISITYQIYIVMNKKRSLSGRKIDQYFSSNDSSRYIYPGTSCKKEKRQRVAAEVSDWTQLLKQISNVTTKVQKLCKQDKKKTQMSRPRIQMKINLSKLQHQQPHGHITNDYQNQILTQKRQNGLKSCNPDCHYLMYECMKLNNENRKLIEEKQQLEKRLYYQSKEKRQLRWALEKQRQKGRVCQQDNRKELAKNHSFTLRISKADNTQEGSVNFGLSQSSYMTAKKSQVLKERTNNLIKPKEGGKDEQDSLLIDLSVRGSENIKPSQKSEQKLFKIMKSMSFEKNLDELLEVCKVQPDPEKKKILRKQMKYIAQQIKSLKSQ